MQDASHSSTDSAAVCVASGPHRRGRRFLPGRVLRSLRSGVQACAITAGSAAILLLASYPAEALTWKWSALLGPGRSAEGTFETDGTLPSAGTTYTITGIKGVYTTPFQTYKITGLSTAFSSDNQFQWNGIPGSSILSDDQGISFTTEDLTGWPPAPGPIVNLYSVNYDSSDPNNYVAIDEWLTFDGMMTLESGTVLSSTLTPEVPGPLPIFGATATFAWSRRLRRRVQGKTPQHSTYSL